jgi:hypothetical protein
MLTSLALGPVLPWGWAFGKLMLDNLALESWVLSNSTLNKYRRRRLHGELFRRT